MNRGVGLVTADGDGMGVTIARQVLGNKIEIRRDEGHGAHVQTPDQG